MNSLGRLVLVDFFGCSPEILNDVPRIESSMVAAAQEAGATIISSFFHHFSPFGVSGVVVIQESHLAIHTWPEYRYAAVDLFTCGHTVNPWISFDKLKADFHADYGSALEMNRGQLELFERLDIDLGELRNQATHKLVTPKMSRSVWFTDRNENNPLSIRHNGEQIFHQKSPYQIMVNSNDSLLTFDPSGVGLENGNLYGLPCDYDTAGTIIFGVPWEVTVSYHTGTAQGPARVLAASPQLDLYDLDNPNGWRQGIFMPPIPEHLLNLNPRVRAQANRVIEATETGIAVQNDPDLAADLSTVNGACDRMITWLYDQASAALDQGKRVGVIGGDHSVPLGYLKALAERVPDFGILHIDAHADLRHAYQGFHYSHASIMYNVLHLREVSKLVQVGIRDICHDEVALIEASDGRVVTYFDSILKENQYQGIPWLQQCETIIANLPQQVYISFDVDGLDPKLCPNTGTPVPGGLELEEVFCLFRQIIRSGRQIIGFDVCEVGNGEWDGNVGARAVYKLCCLMGI